MKLQTTRKAVLDYYKDNVIAVGYCALQNLLWYKKPFAYTTGTYGWNADIYKVNDVVIVTGYRTFGKKIDYKTVKKYNDIARKITDKSYDTDSKKRQLNRLLEKFVEEVMQ